MQHAISIGGYRCTFSKGGRRGTVVLSRTQLWMDHITNERGEMEDKGGNGTKVLVCCMLILIRPRNGGSCMRDMLTEIYLRLKPNFLKPSEIVQISSTIHFPSPSILVQ